MNILTGIETRPNERVPDPMECGGMQRLPPIQSGTKLAPGSTILNAHASVSTMTTADLAAHRRAPAVAAAIHAQPVTHDVPVSPDPHPQPRGLPPETRSRAHARAVRRGASARRLGPRVDAPRTRAAALRRAEALGAQHALRPAARAGRHAQELGGSRRGRRPRVEEKRLAVHVEDHPLEYANFEGVIPAGNYGAGSVIVWDRGWYRSFKPEDLLEQYERGKLELELFGFKLRGRWTLVRMGKKEKEWLLLKKVDGAATEVEAIDRYPESVISGLTVEEMRDAAGHARRRARARGVARARRSARSIREKVPLMLATLAERAAVGSATGASRSSTTACACWRRATATTCELFGRSGEDITARYPEIAAALRALADAATSWSTARSSPRTSAAGRASSGCRRAWRSTQAARHRGGDGARAGARDVLRLPRRSRATTCAACRSRSARNCSRASCRRSAPCSAATTSSSTARRSSRPPPRWGSRASSPSGSASPLHRPALARLGQDQVPAAPGVRDRRLHRAAGLARALRRAPRRRLRRRTARLRDARSAPASTSALLDEIARAARAARSARRRRSTATLPTGKGHTGSSRKLVCEVRFTEWTRDGGLRHPTFLGLRPDEKPEECRREEPVRDRSEAARGATPKRDAEPRPTTASESATHRRPRPAPAPRAARSAAIVRRTIVQLTNLKKVFWPEGYTKGDLIAYYDTVAPLLLPYLRDRPVVLTRYPDGIDGKSFFQKDAPVYVPDWMRTGVDLLRRHRARHPLLRDRRRRVAALRRQPRHDPDPRVERAGRRRSSSPTGWCSTSTPRRRRSRTWCRWRARSRRSSTSWSCPSYVKTSGATGLHVLIPMGRRYTHEETRTFARLLAMLDGRGGARDLDRDARDQGPRRQGLRRLRAERARHHDRRAVLRAAAAGRAGVVSAAVGRGERAARSRRASRSGRCRSASRRWPIR